MKASNTMYYHIKADCGLVRKEEDCLRERACTYGHDDADLRRAVRELGRADRRIKMVLDKYRKKE